MQTLRVTNCAHVVPCKPTQRLQHKRPTTRVCAAPTRQYTLSSVDTSVRGEDLPLTADGNYTYLCTNMGETLRAPVSGYAGGWSRYKGPSLDKPLANGDLIYGFRYAQWVNELAHAGRPSLYPRQACIHGRLWQPVRVEC